MEDVEICDNWEQFSEDQERLEKQLEKLTTSSENTRSKPSSRGTESWRRADVDPNTAQNVPPPETQPQFRLLLRNKGAVAVGIPSNSYPNPVELDSSCEESLRTQYVPPQPTLKILSRPKKSVEKKETLADKKSQVATKSFEQREREYGEARMRILGDVRFLQEEKEAELESNMSAAEILKMKINKSLMNDMAVPNSASEDKPLPQQAPPVLEQDTTTEATKGLPSTSKSKNKRKSKTRVNQNVVPPIHFPPSKMDSDRIHRQPRGPDGTTGFSSSR